MDKEEKQELYEMVYDICEELEIKPPKISYDRSALQTDSMIAIYDPESNIIYINDTLLILDILFAVAHELRHIWQWQTDRKRYFKGYKQRSEEPNIEKYNLQLAEIDANAYAFTIMQDFYNLEPTFQGMPEKVVHEIHKRIGELEF